MCATSPKRWRRKATCLTCLTISGKPPQLWRYRPDGLKPFDALDVAIAPSDFLRGMIAPYLRAPVVHIPNFAPDPNPSGQASSPGDYYLYVGRLEFYKGIPELANAEGILAGIEQFEAEDLAHGQRRAARMAYETYHTPAKYLENYERLIEATWERKLASRNIHPAEIPEMSVGSPGGRSSPISSGEALGAHSKMRPFAHRDESHDP